MGDEITENNMIIVRWVWISLNIVLVLYGVALFIYAKYFKDKQTLIFV
jgi:hypothetical protein